MSLTNIIKIRDAVEGLCAAIDAGEVHPTEPEMLAIAMLAQREGGPLAFDLMVKIAARCENGRVVLSKMAQ